MSLLDVENLWVEFPTRYGSLAALRGIGFALQAGERLGIVGESGAGKSMVAFAILNLVSPPGRITKGRVMFDGQDLAALSDEGIRRIRGNRIAMIFQDPMMTLNPVLTVGTQMIETLKAHREITEKEARGIALAKLREVQVPSPEARINAYPHELSGGLRQRVVIAIALLAEPALIIADEPTTALDVTIQAEVLGLLLALCRDHQTSLILITHDLAVVSQVTERVIVMYAGRIAEAGPTRRIIDAPRHPYTAGLIAALPQQNRPGQPLNQIPGAMPSLVAIPDGCAFAPRCPLATGVCHSDVPGLRCYSGRQVACHHAETAGLSGAGAVTS
jgi:peptide/nickel transport system ATP-binding protein